MTISLSAETKARISTAHAPAPSPNIDGNIGKKASISSGPYAGLQGIIYSRHEGIRYVGEFGQLITGDAIYTKPYLLMFFYDDGTFFCAVETKLSEMTVVGGAVAPPEGSGTPAAPFTCGVLVEAGTGSGDFYHQLPNYAGLVKIYYNMYGIADSLDVYYINDLGNKIASTNGPVQYNGVLTFFYDPAFNPKKIFIRLTGSAYGTSWEYTVDCPIV